MSILLSTHPLKYGAAAVAASVCALSLIAALQFSIPQSMPVLLPFSESFYAHTLSTTESDKRIRLAEQTVAASPNRAESWLLLATARQQRDSQISEDVLKALRQSYRVGPLAPDAHDWRLNYVFSNWHQMPADLRAHAMAEAEAYFTRYAGSVYIRQLAETAADKEGAMALHLVVLTHDRTREGAQRVAEYRAKQNSGARAENK